MNKTQNSHENVVLFLQQGLKDNVDEKRDSEEQKRSDSELYGSDPLEDLLHEFDDVAPGLIDTENEEAKNALAQVVEKMNLPEEILAMEFSRSVELKTKMQLLEEVNQRIKYYLDEVELFIPKRKK